MSVVCTKVVPLKDRKELTIQQKNYRYKEEDAMVEITVKVKKKKDKSKAHLETADATLPHRAGSWGDLLMKKKQTTDSVTEIDGGNRKGVVSKKDSRHKEFKSGEGVRVSIQTKEKDDRTKRSRSKYTTSGPRVMRDEQHVGTASEFDHKYGNMGNEDFKMGYGGLDACVLGRCCGACTCHRINMKNQESQTAIVRPAPGNESSPPTKDVRKSGGMPKISNVQASRSAPEKQNYRTELNYGREQGAQTYTDTRNVSLGRRSRTSDVVDQAAVEAERKRLAELERENQMLRKNAEALLNQVDKAKTERSEYITTIKELYELAEVLRHENVLLIGTHEEHRALQDKLQEAIGENQVLKEHLHNLTSKSSVPQETSKGNESQIKDFWKVRDILKEVKSVIADEIHGLQKVSLSKSEVSNRLDLMDLLGKSNMDIPGLNDTNMQCDDEIQQILNTSNNLADRSEIRSSTQYLDVEDCESFEQIRRFMPSPPQGVSD